MEYVGADGPLVSFSNVDKGIITLAINRNLNFYMENIKNRTSKHYKHFTPFQKNSTNNK